MERYEFPIVLAGEGDTPEEAWNNAVEAFTLDPGIPDQWGIDDGNKLVCSECGSEDVEYRVWKHANTGRIDENVDDNDCWCNNCEQHYRLINKSDYVKAS